MKQSDFNFNLLDTKKPEEVIRDLLQQISMATQNRIFGKIEEYTGEIESYTKSSLTSMVSIASGLSGTKIDIQSELGELFPQRNKFEVYLSVSNMEYYKYRMMFIEYGSTAYPVKIVMNEDIYHECFKKNFTPILASSMSELENIIQNAIDSETMLKLLQSLINESLRIETSKNNSNNG
ncbi:Uncharacterised protein [Faecalicoccus pleomorphus]|uniref:Uncharacterized protein n=1 Tax=Faecalicoccus pleomorphus TaxID=1323 RepID=A0A380LK66_9FIRM|nr:hypothetical protein [Faecalicoccus pleomorphus]SUO03202.1 Uncharacterised protein [Faecalicoccus pleomorphus]